MSYTFLLDAGEESSAECLWRRSGTRRKAIWEMRRECGATENKSQRFT